MAAIHVRTDSTVTKPAFDDERAALTPPLTPPRSEVTLPRPSRKAEDVPENYVEHTLNTTKALPPITWRNAYSEINWLSLAILTVTPAVAIYGFCTTPLYLKTAIWSVAYYFITGLGQSPAIPRKLGLTSRAQASRQVRLYPRDFFRHSF